MINNRQTILLISVFLMSCSERILLPVKETAATKYDIYFIASKDSTSFFFPKTSLYSMKSVSSDITEIKSFERYIEGELKVSPDSQTIMIGASFLINRDGSFFYEYLGTIEYAVWSPTGEELICEFRDYQGDIEICKTDIYGMNPEYLTNNEVDDRHPVWSPEGDKIFFDCKGQIWQMKPDGSDKQIFIDTTFTLSNIRFNYDGSFFSFLVQDSVAHDNYICIGNPENHFLMHTNVKHDYQWSPIGNYIVYYDYSSGIILFDVNDISYSLIHPIESGYFYSNPKWSPDGKQILYYFNDESNKSAGGLRITELLTKKTITIIDHTEYVRLYSFLPLPEL